MHLRVDPIVPTHARGVVVCDGGGVGDQHDMIHINKFILTMVNEVKIFLNKKKQILILDNVISQL